MMRLLVLLEPKFEPKWTIILNELEEVNEMTFVNKGEVVVGYEFNKQINYCIQKRNGCLIGMYGIIFNQRSEIIYTA